MKEGDFIVSINNRDVKWAHHEEVVKLIREAGDSLTLKLVTPMDRNYLKVSWMVPVVIICPFLGTGKCFILMREALLSCNGVSRNCLQPKNKTTCSSNSSVSSDSGGTSSRSSSTYQHSPSGSVNTQKKLTWNPFRKQKDKDTRWWNCWSTLSSSLVFFFLLRP